MSTAPLDVALIEVSPVGPIDKTALVFEIWKLVEPVLESDNVAVSSVLFSIFSVAPLALRISAPEEVVSIFLAAS